MAPAVSGTSRCLGPRLAETSATGPGDGDRLTDPAGPGSQARARGANDNRPHSAPRRARADRRSRRGALRPSRPPQASPAGPAGPEQREHGAETDPEGKSGGNGVLPLFRSAGCRSDDKPAAMHADACPARSGATAGGADLGAGCACRARGGGVTRPCHVRAQLRAGA